MFAANALSQTLNSVLEWPSFVLILLHNRAVRVNSSCGVRGAVVVSMTGGGSGRIQQSQESGSGLHRSPHDSHHNSRSRRSMKPWHDSTIIFKCCACSLRGQSARSAETSACSGPMRWLFTFSWLVIERTNVFRSHWGRCRRSVPVTQLGLCCRCTVPLWLWVFYLMYLITLCSFISGTLSASAVPETALSLFQQAQAHSNVNAHRTLCGSCAPIWKLWVFW